MIRTHMAKRGVFSLGSSGSRDRTGSCSFARKPARQDRERRRWARCWELGSLHQQVASQHTVGRSLDPPREAGPRPAGGSTHARSSEALGKEVAQKLCREKPFLRPSVCPLARHLGWEVPTAMVRTQSLSRRNAVLWVPSYLPQVPSFVEVQRGPPAGSFTV
ncbi:hypothetical protein GH733_006971 [Mirounga leonina]|nr:hypothetical protein GH733_006971 [Mirounga leonina]